MTQETIIEGLPKQIDDSVLGQFIPVLMDFTGETIFYDNYVNDVILKRICEDFCPDRSFIFPMTLSEKRKYIFSLKRIRNIALFRNSQ